MSEKLLEIEKILKSEEWTRKEKVKLAIVMTRKLGISCSFRVKEGWTPGGVSGYGYTWNVLQKPDSKAVFMTSNEFDYLYWNYVPAMLRLVNLSSTDKREVKKVFLSVGIRLTETTLVGSVQDKKIGACILEVHFNNSHKAS